MNRYSLAILGLMLLTLVSAARVLDSAGDTVRIDNLTYQPASVEIRVGGTITWKNADQRDHTVNADNGAFRSGNIPPGGAFSFTFTKPGTYTYGSRYYPRMRGTVIVK